METQGLGAVGTCICLKCGFEQAHSPGVPCRTERCPRCGATLIRKGSEHHAAYLEKQAARDEQTKEPSET